jgi:hypothetical protein
LRWRSAASKGAGARRELPLKEIRRFQFARGSSLVTSDAFAELDRAAARFDREITIEVTATCEIGPCVGLS